MSNQIKVDAVVVEVQKGNKYFCKIEEGTKHTALCTMSGKMRIRRISIVEGDRVLLSLSPYDLTRGRIIWRY